MMITAGELLDLGETFMITSCVDGTHGHNSLHYSGLAFDLRTRDLATDPGLVVQRLREALGAEFDVVLEPTHIHVEFQPEGPVE